MELLHQKGATVHFYVAILALVAGDASIFAQHAGLLRIPIAVASIVLHSTKLSLLMELASLIVHILPTFPMLIFNISNAMMMIMKVILPK